ncbi:hypothetical protein BDK51DRAFT_41169 [Blyttiomyces helicus]|uniref:Uncharacterized protein n=1 Tax=Blyttiomyces helicus TaxID=388810 RepID=A0A4P9W4X4_9FUNG|nr:hypothetical protein BDK51DRAFT_41169 [Blyttiomyces helicus]|eukprot:RKO85938.1 hypothetical protein BDK51DRAFT_41169 [Blyttiomyces helicus]
MLGLSLVRSTAASMETQFMEWIWTPRRLEDADSWLTPQLLLLELLAATKVHCALRVKGLESFGPSIIICSSAATLAHVLAISRPPTELTPLLSRPNSLSTDAAHHTSELALIAAIHSPSSPSTPPPFTPVSFDPKLDFFRLQFQLSTVLCLLMAVGVFCALRDLAHVDEGNIPAVEALRWRRVPIPAVPYAPLPPPPSSTRTRGLVTLGTKMYARHVTCDFAVPTGAKGDLTRGCVGGGRRLWRLGMRGWFVLWAGRR